MNSSRTAMRNGSKNPRTRDSEYLQIDPSSTFLNKTRCGISEDLPKDFLDTVEPNPVIPSGNSTNEESSSIAKKMQIPSNPYLVAQDLITLNTNQADGYFSNPLLFRPYDISENNSESQIQSVSPPNYNGSSETIPSYFHGYYDYQNAPMNDIASTNMFFGSDLTSLGQTQSIGNDAHLQSGYVKQSPAEYQPPKRDQQRVISKKTPYQRTSRGKKVALSSLDQSSPSTIETPSIVTSSSDFSTPLSSNVKPSCRISSIDSNALLNAEIGVDFIDTKDLCARIAFELKEHSIAQSAFAERILCRSQGTLSDLLRNPKPWDKLKSGRDTYIRMYNWFSLPLDKKLAILEADGVNCVTGIPLPTSAQNSSSNRNSRKSTSKNETPSKGQRLVFTDVQKKALKAIFQETERPSKDMQQTIADHLRLDLTTVVNFFMNARRRRNHLTADNKETKMEIDSTGIVSTDHDYLL